MKYPIKCKNIIDVTEAPYYADNTGNTDCTEILRKVFDDVLIREAEGVKKTYDKLIKMSENQKNTVYDGFENRVYDETCEEVGVNVIYPEITPSSKIIYFPKGTYLVSDSVSYTLNNLKNIYLSEEYSELCRGIHVMGESAENTIIKLKDNSKGFEKGAEKAVLSFVNAPSCREYVLSNVCQCNSIYDISVDCGSGNDGAVGLWFMSINSGKISNVKINAVNAMAGIYLNSTASITDIEIHGFDVGIKMNRASSTVVDRADLKNNDIAVRCKDTLAVIKDVYCSDNKLLVTEKSDNTHSMIYVLSHGDIENDKDNNCSIYRKNELNNIRRDNYPINQRSQDANDWICVDDFGAIGDGVTDSTEAIQKAFNSGKKIIIFGEGHYLVNDEVFVPSTVETIDFMFCDLFSGDKLINTKGIGFININEESDKPLFLENLYAFEQFYGELRLIKHTAKRNLIMNNLHTQASALYFNTVGGSKVFMDNCASTTGTYAYNCILRRIGNTQYYCKDSIPFEFHNQKVYGMQINPERAEVEILNDASEILIDAYKVEGPGTAIKTINNGTSIFNVSSVAIGYNEATNPVMETIDSRTILNGVRIADVCDELSYNKIILQKCGECVKEIYKKRLKGYNNNMCWEINCYDSNRIDEIK